MRDFLADVDPNDVHFRLARLPSPPEFEADGGTVIYKVGDVVREGPGSVRADLHSVRAAMEYDDPLEHGEIRVLTDTTAGKMIGADRLGSLSGTTSDGGWSASGAYVIRRSGDPLRPSVDLRLNEVIVRGPSSEMVTFTREIFYGARLEFLTACFSTPISSTEASRDRTEEIAFGRRISLRDLRESTSDKSSATSVVYDGAPLDEPERQAVWLAVSLLAGAALQAAVVETYDAAGELVERVYRPGVGHGPRGDAPFHMYYAKYELGIFATLCGEIARYLAADFPIDVVIAHLHDANDGSMERRMQSSLFAIHAASEAWNRLYEKTSIVDGALWKRLKNSVAAAAREVTDAFDKSLGESVANSVLNANNTSGGSRLRLFFRRIGLTYAGKTKRAIELRNKLFHDGYLQRKFSSLEGEAQQERYDDLQRLREFTIRMVFALCDMDVQIHSLLNPYESVPSRDAVPDRNDAGGEAQR